MDDEERDELLYRIDERTERIDRTNVKIHNRLNRHEQAIKANQKRSQSNDEKIKVGGFLGGTAITAVFTKVAGIIPI